MPDLLGDRGAVRIVEPKVEPLEPCLGCTLRRLTVGLVVGLLRLVELERPNRRVDGLGLVDCLGLEGVRKIRGPDEKEGFCLLRPSDRCPREPPAKALSGWTRGVEGVVTPPCLFAVALEPALDPAAGRSVPDRLGPLPFTRSSLGAASLGGMGSLSSRALGLSVGRLDLAQP